MRKLSILAAAAMTLAPVAAQAAEATCLTPSEFSSLAGYALPSVITGTTQRCSASLGPQAWLPRNGADLAARYSANKAASWPAAKAAFLKLSSSDPNAGKLMQGLPDNTLQTMLDAVMSGMASQKIPVEKCGTIDRFVSLLAPLPATNTAELISLLVEVGAKPGDARLGKLSICQA